MKEVSCRLCYDSCDSYAMQRNDAVSAAGVDFMTIAAWLGHSDGGVLVDKNYGHLADEHKRRMAESLSILAHPPLLVGLPDQPTDWLGVCLLSPGR